MKRRIGLSLLAVVLAAALASSLSGQGGKTYAIHGAKIFTLAGPPIENGTVVIRDGKIVAVGADVPVPTGAQVIEAKGMQVYPGFFDSFSQLGLTEVESVPATVDIIELGEFNPQLVTADAVHPASEHIPVARANGVTHAVSAPFVAGFGGGATMVRGQASAINLNGWVIDEMLVRRSAGLVINWPTITTQAFDFSTFSFRRRPYREVKEEYEKRLGELTDWIGEARHYAQAVEKGSPAKFERDLKLEAMIPVVKGELPVIVVANRQREIKDAAEFCEKNGLKMILAGGGEAWKVKDLLKAKNIPVILGPSQTLPLDEDDPYDKPYSRAGELSAAGIKIAIATFNSADSRTLPYEAGQSVPFGLPWEEALKAITLYPAQILGLDKQLGTIEPGKTANVVVTTGDALELRTEVKHVFINGVPVDLMNRHLRLYETYKRR